jgi:hypothetical protein
MKNYCNLYKICTECKVEKPKSEFYLVVKPTYMSHRPKCKPCYNEIAMKRHAEKPRTKEQNRAASADFRKMNPGYTKESSKQFRLKHPGRVRASNALHKAYKVNATPKWLTKDQRKQIQSIYVNCPKGYHVDHIIPIRGREVRGLHVPWNLQYLPALENIQKQNKIIEGNQ